MSKLCFVTTNKNKINEIKALLPASFIIKTPKSLGHNLNIEETGKTFYDNAHIKAKTAYDILVMPCLADDSGLIVEALENLPGIYSARYAGNNASGDDNNNKLLNKLEGVKNRKAFFHTSIVYIDNDGEIKHFQGRVYGTITEKHQGGRKFGYDPIFIPVGYKKTFSHFTIEEKNRISHRGIAINKFIKYIMETL